MPKYYLNDQLVTDVVRPVEGGLEVMERHWHTQEIVREPDGSARTMVLTGKVRVEAEPSVPSAQSQGSWASPPGPPQDPRYQNGPCPSCGGACEPGQCYCGCSFQARVWCRIGHAWRPTLLQGSDHGVPGPWLACEQSREAREIIVQNCSSATLDMMIAGNPDQFCVGPYECCRLPGGQSLQLSFVWPAGKDR